jgi:hypothetical protein
VQGALVSAAQKVLAVMALVGIWLPNPAGLRMIDLDEENAIGRGVSDNTRTPDFIYRHAPSGDQGSNANTSV